jgi:hypothetical protein
MIFHASNYTNFAAGVTDSPVLSGNSIKVIGIIVESTAGGQVLVEENDGSTLITKISVVANGTTVVDIPFVAPRGIKITTPANTTCTVFHTQVV